MVDLEKDIVPWEVAAVKSNHNVQWESDAGMVLGKAGKPQVSFYLFDLWGPLAANAIPFGGGGVPTAGSFTPYAIPQDNFVPPRKLFYFDHPRWMIQVFPSLNNADALFWLRHPLNQPRGGFITTIGNPDVNYRFPYGWWFEGKDSDIDNPTNAGEFWVPPQTDLEISVLNTTNVAFRPECVYVMVQFPIKPFDPQTETGKKCIMAILRGNAPVTDGSIGGDNTFSMSQQTFRQLFGVNPVHWDGMKASYTDPSGAEVTIGEV